MPSTIQILGSDGAEAATQYFRNTNGDVEAVTQSSYLQPIGNGFTETVYTHSIADLGNPGSSMNVLGLVPISSAQDDFLLADGVHDYTWAINPAGAPPYAFGGPQVITSTFNDTGLVQPQQPGIIGSSTQDGHTGTFGWNAATNTVTFTNGAGTTVALGTVAAGWQPVGLEVDNWEQFLYFVNASNQVGTASVDLDYNMIGVNNANTGGLTTSSVPATVTIDQAGATTYNSNQTLSGSVTTNYNGVGRDGTSVLLFDNGRMIQSAALINGHWSANITLSSGTNSIVAEAFDTGTITYGSTPPVGTSSTVSFTLSPPPPPPPASPPAVMSAASTGPSTIIAGDWNVEMVAGAGTDVMIAGNGRDTFYGGPGTDYMYGGSGKDTFIGGTGLNIEEGNGGNDWFYLSDANGSEAYGGNGNSTFIAGKGNAVMIGGSGNDTMFGGNGNDYFYGGSGNDEFFGGAGTDVMVANGAGTDYFDGGTGVNYYFGGKGGGPGTALGHDTFALNDTGAVQSIGVVQDWTEGLGHVNLSNTGLTSFDDLMAHSYQNGAYFVVQPDANNAIWLNGATASTVTASDFSIVS
jgi:Ca2+-binding RTX toxin-like protein